MVDSADKIRASGSFEVLEQTPTLIRTRVTGYFDVTVCSSFITMIEAWRGDRTGITAFHDIRGMDDYDVIARERMSRWLKTQIGTHAAAHMLVERRTIAWALDVIGMVSGFKMKTYHSLAAFEAAYEIARKAA